MSQEPTKISTAELVETIREMLLVREGETIDDNVATERARNIACALSGVVVDDSAQPR